METEHESNYFVCSKKDVPALIARANKKANDVLKDFREFFVGNFEIVIEPVRHITCWSIAATLTVNGKPAVREDPCDLLFLELNDMILNQMLKLGFLSKGGER